MTTIDVAFKVLIIGKSEAGGEFCKLLLTQLKGYNCLNICTMKQFMAEAVYWAEYSGQGRPKKTWRCQQWQQEIKVERRHGSR